MDSSDFCHIGSVKMFCKILVRMHVIGPSQARLCSAGFRQAGGRALPGVIRMWRIGFIVFLFQLPVLAGLAGVPLSLAQVGSLLEITNGNVHLEYNLGTGRANFYWQNSMKISGFYAGASIGS